ncbi:50S ribosomal protein L25 [Candidatus Bipolaricaulota bacterium]|nr:50S ribosomal protein L25 [Candidatus Bipolaricaulota bacterium]MBS3814215.1 50S ribosomal protein L25 [Candidatus Bipolaricaulota bacterium]MBS3825019.1 50S ribosomal protein L25 [Candidatus Bipolaricaulota bacterium]
MEAVEVSKRESGENPNSLRRKGKLPGVLYGPKRESTSVKVDEKEMKDLMKEITRSTRLKLVIDDETHKVFIRNIQYDHLTDDPVHLDFYEVPDDYPVEMEIPVVTVGTPEGVSSGGIMDQLMETITVHGKATDIPEILRLDVEELEIGDSIHVSDLDLGDLEILTPKDRTVLSILAPRKEIEIDLTEPTIGEELLGEEEELAEGEEEELAEGEEEELAEGEEEELAEGEEEELAEGEEENKDSE